MQSIISILPHAKDSTSITQRNGIYKLNGLDVKDEQDSLATRKWLIERYSIFRSSHPINHTFDEENDVSLLHNEKEVRMNEFKILEIMIYFNSHKWLYSSWWQPLMSYRYKCIHVVIMYSFFSHLCFQLHSVNVALMMNVCLCLKPVSGSF